MLRSERGNAHAEIRQFLALHEIQDRESFIDPPQLEQPVGNAPIGRHLVAQESTIEAPVVADEMASLAFDLGNGLLAEENTERRLVAGVQDCRQLVVGLRQGLRHSRGFRRGYGAYCVAASGHRVESCRRQPALIAVDLSPQIGL
jgi:hypothetical protein